MLEKNYRKRILIFCSLFILLITLVSWSVYRIRYINIKYPKPICYEYSIGEPFDYYGTEMTIMGFEIIEYENLKVKYPLLYENLSVEDNESVLVAIPEIKMCNRGGTDQNINITEFALTSKPYSFAVSPIESNSVEGLGKVKITLPPNETYIAKYVYAISDKYLFNPLDFQELLSSQYKLVVSAYPLYIQIKVS